MFDSRLPCSQSQPKNNYNDKFGMLAFVGTIKSKLEKLNLLNFRLYQRRLPASTRAWRFISERALCKKSDTAQSLWETNVVQRRKFSMRILMWQPNKKTNKWKTWPFHFPRDSCHLLKLNIFGKQTKWQKLKL